MWNSNCELFSEEHRDRHTHIQTPTRHKLKNKKPQNPSDATLSNLSVRMNI